MPKYYKHVVGYRYEYGGFGGKEADLVKLDHVICLFSLKFDEGTGFHILSKEDKITLDNFIKDCTSSLKKKNIGVGSSKTNEDVDTMMTTTMKHGPEKLVATLHKNGADRMATKTRSRRFATKFQFVQSY